MQINWNIEKNYLTVLCVFKFNGFHKKGEVWGPRAKICHGPCATLIRPWSLVGSSCGFNANCQRSKESTDNSPRRRITGATQASSVKYGGPGPIIPLKPQWTTIIPTLRRQTFYPLSNLYLLASLELGSRRKLLPCHPPPPPPPPPPPAWAALAPPLSYHIYLLQIIFKALFFFK
jgi:hypothetical protein